MEQNLHISGDCRPSENGEKICRINVNGKSAEVEILSNGDRQLVSNPNDIDRDTLRYAVSQILKKSVEDEFGGE